MLENAPVEWAVPQCGLPLGNALRFYPYRRPWPNRIARQLGSTDDLSWFNA